MTLQEAKDKVAEIRARTDIGPSSKIAQTMRVFNELRKTQPDADMADLG